MKSQATTVAAYLDSLPSDRREAIQTVRRVILDKLDRDIQECMQYGVIGYCVPHSVWPHGHHTNPKLPLMYMGLSSQKNDMVVYMLFLHHNEPEREWFDAAWKATGRKNYLDVSGAGCCLRFKKVEDLSLEVIAEAMRRSTAKKYLEGHIAMLARIGKGPDGKPIKQSGGGKAKSVAAPRVAGEGHATARIRAKGKTAPKRKAATKRG